MIFLAHFPETLIFQIPDFTWFSLVLSNLTWFYLIFNTSITWWCFWPIFQRLSFSRQHQQCRKIYMGGAGPLPCCGCLHFLLQYCISLLYCNIVSPFSIAILCLSFLLQYCVSIFYYNMFVALLCLPFVLQYCVFLLYRNIVPYLFQYCFRLLYCNIVPFLLQYWLRLLYFNIVPFLLQYWLRLLYCNIVTTIETAKSVQIWSGFFPIKLWWYFMPRLYITGKWINILPENKLIYMTKWRAPAMR